MADEFLQSLRREVDTGKQLGQQERSYQSAMARLYASTAHQQAVEARMNAALGLRGDIAAMLEAGRNARFGTGQDFKERAEGFKEGEATDRDAAREAVQARAEAQFRQKQNEAGLESLLGGLKPKAAVPEFADIYNEAASLRGNPSVVESGMVPVPPDQDLKRTVKATGDQGSPVSVTIGHTSEIPIGQYVAAQGPRIQAAAEAERNRLAAETAARAAAKPTKPEKEPEIPNDERGRLDVLQSLHAQVQDLKQRLKDPETREAIGAMSGVKGMALRAAASTGDPDAKRRYEKYADFKQALERSKLSSFAEALPKGGRFGWQIMGLAKEIHPDMLEQPDALETRLGSLDDFVVREHDTKLDELGRGGYMLRARTPMGAGSVVPAAPRQSQSRSAAPTVPTQLDLNLETAPVPAGTPGGARPSPDRRQVNGRWYERASDGKWHEAD